MLQTPAVMKKQNPLHLVLAVRVCFNLWVILMMMMMHGLDVLELTRKMLMMKMMGMLRKGKMFNILGIVALLAIRDLQSKGFST